MQKTNKKSKTTNSVYLGTLDRFGYDIVCVDETEKKVVDAIMANYDDVYQKENNCDPRKTHSYNPDDSDYVIAKREIYVREMEFGKVEWC